MVRLEKAVKWNRLVCVGALMLAVGGCAWLGFGSEAEPEPAPVAAAPSPPHDWVREIRAAASASASSVEVTPLLDPAVADLRARAQEAEAAGDFKAAAGYLEQATQILDDDPSLWQWRAEIALEHRRWRNAANFAQRSLDLGPRIGTLCVRNWLTLKAARTELGDAISAASAEAQVKSCEVPAILRM